MPQDALQLLGRQPASQRSPHVHLGALDERRTQVLVQPGAAPLIGSGDVPLWIAYDDEGSAIAGPSERTLVPWEMTDLHDATVS
jgi:hypothetical protein